jgi:glycerate 2-kinase
MRALLAFDKFKDALTAPEACATAAHVLRARHPDWTLDVCPLADGGEGFSDILTAAVGGRMIASTVTGPREAPVQATMGMAALEKIPAAARALLDLPATSPLPAGAMVAVIELATASGLALLAPEERNPWHATTRGTGELIQMAVELGARAIVLGIGGSATNDLGLGALTALGLQGRTGNGRLIDPPVPARWPDIARFVGGVRPNLPPIRIACDVSNPLLGPQGAAAIYGPQKGLRPADRSRLEHESARLALMLCQHCSQPDNLMDVAGAGAAGGIGFGLMVAAGARLVPGFELVSAWLDLDARIAAADLVITGEGRFDDSSLSGKGPGAVAARAVALGKQAHVFAGKVTATGVGAISLHAITPPDIPLERALPETRTNLAAAVRATL